MEIVNERMPAGTSPDSLAWCLKKMKDNRRASCENPQQDSMGCRVRILEVRAAGKFRLGRYSDRIRLEQRPFERL